MKSVGILFSVIKKARNKYECMTCLKQPDVRQHWNESSVNYDICMWISIVWRFWYSVTNMYVRLEIVGLFFIKLAEIGTALYISFVCFYTVFAFQNETCERTYLRWLKLELILILGCIRKWVLEPLMRVVKHNHGFSVYIYICILYFLFLSLFLYKYYKILNIIPCSML